METIEVISPRASVVSNNGRIYARAVYSEIYTCITDCGSSLYPSSIESARKVARREAWILDAYEWQSRAHKAVIDAERETCEHCVYRNSTGCLSVRCPVFRLLECVNKAPKLIKRTGKELDV